MAMSISCRPFRAATGASRASTTVGVRATAAMMMMMMIVSSSLSSTTTISGGSSSSSPFVAVSALSNHQGPTFSVSEQALFGGYNYGEASLFGGSSANDNVVTMTSSSSTTTTTGRYTNGVRWTGKKDSGATASDASQTQTTTYYGTQHNTNSHVPFQGEMVESMTFMPQTIHGATNIKNKKKKRQSSSSSSSSSRLKP